MWLEVKTDNYASSVLGKISPVADTSSNILLDRANVVQQVSAKP
jgi:hypothetical protein